MTTKIHSTAHAAALLASDPSAEQQAQEEINNSRLISRLIALRVAKGLTQEKIAEGMGCDASKVSRMESGDDYGLRFADLAGYVQALNVELILDFHDRDAVATDQIKESVVRIHENLEKLCALAKQAGEKDKIAEKIHQFYKEVLFNFLIRYESSYQKLPKPMRVVPPHTAQAEKAEPSDIEEFEEKCAP